MGPLVLAALVATSAPGEGFGMAVRVSHGTLGVGDARLRGYGLDDYAGHRDVDVLAREQGLVRPTFTTFDLAVGGSVRYAAIDVTFGGGVGRADQAPTTEVAINGARLGLLRFGVEPRVQLPLAFAQLSLGAWVGMRSVDAPLLGLHAAPGCRSGCGGRASVWQPFFSPRLMVSIPFAESSLSDKGQPRPSIVTWQAQVFGGLDAIHARDGMPFEVGIGVAGVVSSAPRR